MSQNISNSRTGRQLWQSLNHAEDTPEIQQLIANEFQGYNPTEITSMPRRRFLKLMGASMALSGLTLSGCRRWPKEHLAPYASAVGNRIPGLPEQYATSWELGGISRGVLATAYDGRPIKIEGNPSHPASMTWNGKLGSADHYSQATVLELYDPDRSRFVIDRSGDGPRQSSFEQLQTAATAYMKENCPAGAGFYVLSEASESPTVNDMKARMLALLPQAKWVEFEPLSNGNEALGVKQATGTAGRSVLKLDTASVIVSLDCDFLGIHPNHTRYANDFVKGRKSADTAKSMNRLYVVDSTFSLTGSNADDRLPIKPSRLEVIAAGLASALGVSGVPAVSLSEAEQAFVASMSKDLKDAGKTGVVAVGPEASPATHVLAYLINASLGSIGSAVTYVAIADRSASDAANLAAMATDAAAGKVKALLIIGGNPVYDAPADINVRDLLKASGLTIHFSYYQNETSLACKWHCPRSHYLESWGDGRSWDGTISTAQPLIEPIFGTKSTIELLAILTGDTLTDGQSLVRRTLKLADEKAWRKVIHDGVIAGSAYSAVAGGTGSMPKLSELPAASFEVRFVPHYGVYDGRFANLGWLLELPDPLSKLTWDNAALISLKDAAEQKISNGDMLSLIVEGKQQEVAAYIQPGQPQGVITLPLGLGRTAAGNIGGLTEAGVFAVGFNTYALRTRNALMSAPVEFTRTGETFKLVATTDHFLMDDTGFAGREKRAGKKHQSGRIVREATLTAYVASGQKSDAFAYPGSHGPAPRLQIFAPPTNYEKADPGAPDLFNHPHAWGMSIDMTACIGCSACVVACQAENNIPVVGKEMVAVNREMHWLRIDRYFKGDRNDDNPEVVHQPMMCVHCENAPCEQVCPVAATVHDTEGLNTMVYNRCIGTRYCSNNCPYKVRRFNYFDYHSTGPRAGRYRLPYLNWPDAQPKDQIDPMLWMQFNPEVTVRMRGVMEKCTYCTQRIASAKIAARNAWKQGLRDDDTVRDGEIVTACQQACPTEAIVFGNLNDKTSTVRQWNDSPRAYAVLDDLNSRPRTHHLAKVRNPSKEPARVHDDHH
ncbi:MAG TPA: TAT-variant-translocated molybdopterin oxidoreductase [Tepidisphaeraceae bacterium]|nr:TAT-variant-translocated molybdopterin oxidoreductase [Tepidisphaeraceae bacterium]